MPNPLVILDTILKRDEADVYFFGGTVALVAFEIIDRPIGAFMVASQAMARSPSKFLQAVAEVAEEDSATSSDVRRWVRPGGELPSAALPSRPDRQWWRRGRSSTSPTCRRWSAARSDLL